MNHRIASLLRAVQLIALALVLVLSATAAPTWAMGSSNDTKSVDPLPNVRQASEDALDGNLRSLDKVQSRANPGLNSVQGTANAGDMKTPGNASSRSVAQQAKGALEDAKPAS